jgi:hypothetical protein
MARITMPVESGNRAINDGSLGTAMQRAAQRWKPEAMHFTTFDGQRTAFMVFRMHQTFLRLRSRSSWN